ncbi:hypothetical protein [Novosphingobium rosa]|uniref:hypothetical protein n=1 Tax=Novosphingobium rosa TaxID=76978 RepID=UPI00157C9624|nr:hypothetical protein [Novosphingobium rosa]
MHAAPAAAPTPGPADLIERIARDQAKADGCDWDEPCTQDADNDIYCESSTCVSAFYEDHDADAARRHYLSRAGTALATVQAYMASDGITDMDREAVAHYNRVFPDIRLTDAFAAHRRAAAGKGGGFQSGVGDWMLACFGPEVSADRLERADRFTEEALELAQTMPGFTADRAYALVDYVFGRPVGERNQEVGSVMVTLAALCNSFDLVIATEAYRELARVWTKKDDIRAKQASKPVGSALPVVAQADPRDAVVAEAQFLADRLNEMDWSLSMDDFANEFGGHVAPPLARLGTALAKSGGKK